MTDSTLEAHPGRSAGSEDDTNVAVEHQQHGNSRTEAALFNVNIDLFFLKGNDSRFKSLSPVCSLTLARSLAHWLALLLIYSFL